MDTILMILGLATFGTTTQATNWYKNSWFDRKPFNCTLCLTTWSSYMYLCFTHWNLPLETIIFSATSAGVLAEYLDQKINPFK